MVKDICALPAPGLDYQMAGGKMHPVSAPGLPVRHPARRVSVRAYDVAQPLGSTPGGAVDSGGRATNIDNTRTRDLLISDLIWTQRGTQVEFLSEYLVAMPFTRRLSR